MIDNILYDIFNTIFYKKYIYADKIFTKYRMQINDYYKNLIITKESYISLLNIVNIYEKAYLDTFNDASSKRTYKLKVGGGIVKLDTAQSWAELIIEMTDTINKFKDNIIPAIEYAQNPENILQQCKKLNINECIAPCNIEKPFFSKNYCNYHK